MEWDEHEHSSWHCLAKVGTHYAGTGRLQTDGKITRIAVLPEWRGRGVAARMLEQLLKTAHQNHLHPLYLNAQTTAIALYEKYGFRCVENVFDEGGIAHIKMVLE
ncbi:MAG: GNAT family N-acetyltransferase [Pseudomonadota bacterium]